ncbi:thiamine pyrophosphate-binding protein, partial [Kitasatospora phosalacinea]|uniref:thiamine pyrophosphate-binding protein n=1 Tax=Kitasatospora phosalacinea TaxID=2065 RepID=UPI002553C665
MTQLTDSPAVAAVPAPGRPAAAPSVPSVPSCEGAHLTGAEALVRSLETLGVDTVFGIPGGAILPAYDPLMDSTKVRHILVRHEQGAGHAATGYAQ